MKNVLLHCLTIVLVLVACNSNKNDQKNATPAPTTTMDTASGASTQPAAEQLYACSMHPEVTGKKDEACYKCGMKLTVAVKGAANPK